MALISCDTKDGKSSRDSRMSRAVIYEIGSSHPREGRIQTSFVPLRLDTGLHRYDGLAVIQAYAGMQFRLTSMDSRRRGNYDNLHCAGLP